LIQTTQQNEAALFYPKEKERLRFVMKGHARMPRRRTRNGAREKVGLLQEDSLRFFSVGIHHVRNA
jgi:hypothetical protein